jgi:hypothetical protein
MSSDRFLPAAKYWAQFLRDAKDDSEAAAGTAMIDLLHVGGDRISGGTAGIFAWLLNEQAKALTTEGIEAFEKALATAIAAKSALRGGSCAIGVDYDPCEELTEALKAGGMMQASYGQYFPFKKLMRINEDGSFTVERW